MREHTFTCKICGQSLPQSEQMIFDGQELCPHCLEVHTLLCSECGDRLWADDNAGSKGQAAVPGLLRWPLYHLLPVRQFAPGKRGLL